jgi:hypothetical protein
MREVSALVRGSRAAWVVALVSAAVSLAGSSAESAVRRRVDVRYEREDSSKSRPAEAEVTFMTGQELNSKTSSFRYKSFSNYALIWFDRDEVAVIELKSLIFLSGDVFDADDFRTAFALGYDLYGSQVNSPKPRKWFFQGKRMFNWIDPRAEDN